MTTMSVACTVRMRSLLEPKVFLLEGYTIRIMLAIHAIRQHGGRGLLRSLSGHSGPHHELVTFGGMELETYKFLVEKTAPFMNMLFRPEVIYVSKTELHIKIPFHKGLIGNVAVPCYHGGVVATAIDHAAGFCVWASLDDPYQRCNTVDLRVDYLNPAPCEDMYVHAKIEHKSNKLARADAIVYDSQHKKKIALGRTLFNVYKGAEDISGPLKQAMKMAAALSANPVPK
ncbi:PaaI family thioesterase [archaeon]|nr:MAG: PaaI family thioesterase [archaeon]